MAGMSVSVERPRETSKSEPNSGCLGIRASASGNFFLLVRRRRAHVQHVDLHLWLLRRRRGGRSLLRGNLADHRQEQKTIEDRSRNSGHAGILNEMADKSKFQIMASSRELAPTS